MRIGKKSEQPTNFVSFFEASSEEKSFLLEFLLFCEKEEIREKILNHSKFSPSNLWKKWVNSTYIGFSGDSVMLKSGHRFYDSYRADFTESFAIKKTPVDIPRKTFRAHVKSFFDKIDPEPVPVPEKESYLENFKKHYPNFKKPKLYNELMRRHPIPFLRALEVNQLASYDTPGSVFEIGAGACVQASILISEYGCNYTILDLPDTIMVGYCFLKSIYPELRIALPQDINQDWNPCDYDVSFLCPSQEKFLKNNIYDLAVNMSSFQEMDQYVVNNYIDLIHKVLKPGDGNIVLCNQVVSKHIKGNQFKNYCLDKFTQKSYCESPFQDWENRMIEGLRQFTYQAVKK